MKDKILYLILGILIGAVITAGCFLVFSKNARPDMRGERPNFEDMELPEGMELPEDGNFEKENHMRDEKGPRNSEMEKDSDSSESDSNNNQTGSEV